MKELVPIDFKSIFKKVYRDTITYDEYKQASEELTKMLNYLEVNYGDNFRSAFLNEVIKIKADVLSEFTKYSKMYDEYIIPMKKIYKKLFSAFLEIIKTASLRNEKDAFRYRLPVKNNTKSLFLTVKEVASLIIINKMFEYRKYISIKNLLINDIEEIFMAEINSIIFNCKDIISNNSLFKIIYNRDMENIFDYETASFLFNEIEEYMEYYIIKGDEDKVDDSIEQNLKLFGNIMLKKINNSKDLTDVYILFMTMLNERLEIKDNQYIYEDTLNEIFELVMKRKTPKQKKKKEGKLAL